MDKLKAARGPVVYSGGGRHITRVTAPSSPDDTSAIGENRYSNMCRLPVLASTDTATSVHDSDLT